MKKQRLTLLALLLAFLTFSLVFAACGQQSQGGGDENPPSHSHAFEKYASDDTHHWKVCSGCDETAEKAEHTPQYYTTDDTHRQSCSVCARALTDAVAHAYSEGYCECGKEEPYTKYITFEEIVENEKVTSYRVTGWEIDWNEEDATYPDELIIPSYYKGKPVTEIAKDAFLTNGFGSIKIGDNVAVIGVHAFENSYGLRDLELGKGLKDIGDEAFYLCGQLQTVKLPSGIEHIGYSAFGRTAYAEKESNYTGGLLYNGDYLLAALESASGKVTVKNSVKLIAEGALAHTKISSAVLPSHITDIPDWLFTQCYNLESVQTGEITSVGAYAFYQCKKLKAITLTDGVTEIGEQAFTSCEALEAINLPDSITSIGKEAFKNCKALTAISLPKDLTVIEKGAFSDCSELKTVQLPTALETIEQDAFKYCRKLEAVVIPSGVTTIGDEAFSGCVALSSLTIPTSVRSIGVRTFAYLTALETLTYEGTSEQWNSIDTLYDKTFYSCNSGSVFVISCTDAVIDPNPDTSEDDE